jgi:hypothetical protein
MQKIYFFIYTKANVANFFFKKDGALLELLEIDLPVY